MSPALYAIHQIECLCYGPDATSQTPGILRRPDLGYISRIGSALLLASKSKVLNTFFFIGLSGVVGIRRLM